MRFAHYEFAGFALLRRFACCKNKNPSAFATFLQLGTPFCLRKAEMSRFAADSLRFLAEIRVLAPRGNP